MQELTPVVNNLLGALREKAKAPREFNYLAGWKPLPREQLPTLEELAKLHAAYGPITRQQLMQMLLELPRARGAVEISGGLLGAIFDVEAGSYLVTFSMNDKRTVRGFIVGNVAKLTYCSEITNSLVTAFEVHVMPAKAHAAELLNK